MTAVRFTIHLSLLHNPEGLQHSFTVMCRYKLQSAAAEFQLLTTGLHVMQRHLCQADFYVFLRSKVTRNLFFKNNPTIKERPT